MDKYIGKLLDNRYEILEVIGTGGMAVVYKARCRLLNRFVAIKILKDEYAKDADFRRRFHTESQAVAMLSHQNIVSVYDVNRSDNIEYMVMELVEGVTLKDYMDRKGLLSPDEVLHFAPQIAKALEHAHSRGIIHRDIKPQNIIILRDGSLKVTDFGIARFAQSERQTLTDEALGSVHYVSPEQAKGSAIDARSDIYSFGVVMYEMLTGRLPFEGDTPVAVVLQHINSVPLMPREIDPKIPRALESITMKAMCPSIDKRYASATEIIEDFELYKKDPEVEFNYVNTYEEQTEPEVEHNDGDTRKFVPISSHQVRKTVSDETVSVEEKHHADAAKPKKQPKKKAVKYDDDYDDYEYDYVPRRRTPVVVYLITAIITAAVFMGGAMFIFSTIFNPDDADSVTDVEVPSLVGKNYMEVMSSSKYEDYRIIQEETVYNSTVEKGFIIDQSPSAGRTMKPNAEIYVTVSLGPKMVTMPDITNVEYRSAGLELSKLDILYEYAYEISETIIEGNVTRTIPEATTDVEPGSKVTVYVSLGKEVKTTIVPDLKGLTEDEARRRLESCSLVLGEIIPVTSDEKNGIVVGQSYDPNTEVSEKTSVDISISSNAVEPTTPDEDPNDGNFSGETNQSSTGAKKSYVLKVALSSTEEKSLVEVKAMGQTIYEEEYDSSLGKVSITLYGTGSDLLTIYVNGVLKGEEIAIYE